ncbi:MAG TPA: molybdenum cofactor guanylyltransferase MobA [Gammaproteobacteria bacterium]|nr:molybdenum cofactor guanylyltransferase MobA [Gammaproteobacteria bacterium]
MRALITGLVLAGGQGSRLGGRDKGLVEIAGRPLIAHVLARFAPQVDAVLISANRHREIYAGYGHPVIADLHSEHHGPLAGLASGLAHCRTPLLALVPCDAPFLPEDLVGRLYAALDLHAAEIAIAEAGGEAQPTFALLRASLAASAAASLAAGERGLMAWHRRHRLAVVPYADAAAFRNLNTPEDCAAAASRLTAAAPRPRLLGVAGYSGSGKTTLLTRLIPRLVARGLRIGALKHAHHRFDIDYPGKDSYELRRAGAACVMVASAHRDAFIREHRPEAEPVLCTLLAEFEGRGLDLVLVEGFRQERYPKIEVHRRAAGPSSARGLLSADDDSIIALATDGELETPRPMPRFHVDDIDAIAAFVLDHCAEPASAWPRLAREIRR